jgi:DNA repair photolyase
MRIFMSAVTDPYQPLERRYRLTRRCLEAFARYDDLDLLVIQTRSPLVSEDFALIRQIPYAWVSMTLETDRGDLPYGPNAAFIASRYGAIQAAVATGIPVQIVVSPCLPHSAGFADWLIATGVKRIVVDTFTSGDGQRGERTAHTSFADTAGYNWRDESPAIALAAALKTHPVQVEWSADGFDGIPPRHKLLL